MRVPFQIPAEGMEEYDKTGSEIQGFVQLEEHGGNNTGRGMEKAVKHGTILKKKVTEVIINGKNAMSMSNVNKLEGHRGSALHGIEITAGGKEAAVIAERDKFQLTTVRTAIYGTTKRRITAVDYFIQKYKANWIVNLGAVLMMCSFFMLALDLRPVYYLVSMIVLSAGMAIRQLVGESVFISSYEENVIARKISAFNSVVAPTCVVQLRERRIKISS